MICIAGVELAPDEWNVRARGVKDLLMHLLHGVADHLVGQDGAVVMKYVFGGVVAIDMRGYEVERHMIFGGVRYHVADPCRLRRGRAAHAQAGAHGFEGTRRMVIEGKVGALRGLAAPEADVWLIPDFEVPLRNFIDAVARDQVPGKGCDERVPLCIAGGRRDVGVIPEGLENLLLGQIVGHEADLYVRLDAVRQQRVVDVVHVGPVVERVAVFIDAVDAVFIVEDGVKADVLEVSHLAHLVEVGLVLRAHDEVGAAGAEHLLPVMRKRCARRMHVDGDGRGLGGRCGRGVLRERRREAECERGCGEASGNGGEHWGISSRKGFVGGGEHPPGYSRVPARRA